MGLPLHTCYHVIRQIASVLRYTFVRVWVLHDGAGPQLGFYHRGRGTCSVYESHTRPHVASCFNNFTLKFTLKFILTFWPEAAVGYLNGL